MFHSTSSMKNSHAKRYPVEMTAILYPDNDCRVLAISTDTKIGASTYTLERPKYFHSEASPIPSDNIFINIGRHLATEARRRRRQKASNIHVES